VSAAATCTITPDGDCLRYEIVVRDDDGTIDPEGADSGTIARLSDMAWLATLLDDGCQVEARSATGRPDDIGEMILSSMADRPGALHLEHQRDRRYVASLLDAVWCPAPYSLLSDQADTATYEWLQEADDYDAVRTHAEAAAGADADAYAGEHGSLEGCGEQPDGDHGWWAALADDLEREPTDKERAVWLGYYAGAMRERHEGTAGGAL